MSAQHRFGLALLVPIALLSPVGCEAILGIKELPVAESSLVDAQADAVPDAAPDAPADADAGGPDAPTQETGDQEAGCSKRPPTPPPDNVDGGSLELVFALDDLDLGGTNEGWKQLGFDLDQMDTQPDAGGSRCQSMVPVGSPPESTWWDHPCGVDNVTGTLLWEEVNALYPTLGADLAKTNEEIRLGKRGLVLRIQGYNGLPDDDGVTVSAYVAVGTIDTPQWKGDDPWWVDTRSVAIENELISKYVDIGGYVADHVVVARFKEFPASASFGRAADYAVPLEDCLFTATLIPGTPPTPARLVEGRLGGTLRATTLFRAIAGNTCLSAPIHKLLSGYVCTHRDLRVPAPPANEFLPCNGFSMALGFNALAVILAGHAVLDAGADGGNDPDACPDYDCPD